jgi:acyl-coenzyme A thioesterase 9
MSPIQVLKDFIFYFSLKITKFPGKSTIEVRLDVMDQEDDIKMSAMFLFACRDKNQLKGKQVPKITDYDLQDKNSFYLREMLGRQNQINRKKKAEYSLKNHIPSVEEVSLLHELLFNKEREHIVENKPSSNEFKLEKVIYAHEQNKNVHGKLFGGNIMRECFEIAFMAAFMLGNGEVPELYHIGDTQVN